MSNSPSATKRKKNFTSVLKRSTNYKVGVASITIQEAADIVLPKKVFDDEFFCVCVIGDEEAVTDVAEGNNPRWGDTVQLPVFSNTSSLTVTVYAGSDKSKRDKYVAECDVPVKGGQSSEDWYPLLKKGKNTKERGRLMVRVEQTISGTANLLAAVATDAGKEEAEDEEVTKTQLLRAAPGLLRDLKFAVFRVLYAAEPLLIARKSIMELLLWKSKPASAISLLVVLYVFFYNLVIPALSSVVAVYLALKMTQQIRSQGKKLYLPANEYETKELFIEATVKIKDATRM